MKRNRILRCVFLMLFVNFSLLTKAQDFNQVKADITSFEIVLNQNKVNINWQTPEKTPANYFEVERSNDGENFKTVAYVLGPDPTKTNRDFGCLDQVTAKSKNIYYRLKQVEENGEVVFSNVKMIAGKDNNK